MSKPRDPERLLKHLDTFFGIRNGIKGNPVEGVNFTKETLTYMTSRARADQITQMIVDRMKQAGNTVPFGVFECCAGMGGNTLSFLDRKDAVQWVVSYEIVPERRQMLKKNIEMYNLAQGQRSFVPEEGFNGVPPNYKGVVLYFDPPWLPAGIKGDESTKDQYVLRGVKVGNKTLEEWIASSPHVAMTVFRMPPGYQLDPIPGFNVESVLLKNSLVFFVTPVKPGEEQRAPIQTVAQKKQTVQPALTESPAGVPGVGKEDMKWYEGLRNYLRTLLLRVTTNSDYIEKMVSVEAMKTWVPCFTSESYNPNVGYNYEELEMVGDHAMEYNFIMYLYLNYPGINRGELSELKSHYISKPYQAKVSLELGLNDWVRSRGIEVNTHVFEDLLESFFGGLNIVGNNVFKFGAGTGLCYSMINSIFENVEIDFAYADGKPKTIIKETFEQLHWGVAIENVMDGPDGNSVVMTVSLTPEAVASLATIGVQIDPLLASEPGTTKKVASDNAYAVALKRLRQIGITKQWVEKVVGNRDARNEELAPLLPQVEAKIKAAGYESFYMKKMQTVRAGKYYHLIGVKPDKTRVTLVMNQHPMKDTPAKKDLLVRYLRQ